MSDLPRIEPPENPSPGIAALPMWAQYEIRGLRREVERLERLLKRSEDGSEQIDRDLAHAEAEVARLREALGDLWFELEAGTRDSARYAFRHLHSDAIADLESRRASDITERSS